ncbi:unnamed protein product, partial [Ranitomeya imitator]
MRLHPHTLPHEAPSPHITTRGSIHTHYHMRLRPHTLSHEALSPHITTRGSVPPHYHMRLRPHTLPYEAQSPQITTRGSVLTHYHTRLRPHTLPHEAPSTYYHTRLRPHTLPHEAASPHITTRRSVPTHYHTRLRPHTLPHEAPSPHITTRGSVPAHYHTRLSPHTCSKRNPPEIDTYPTSEHNKHLEARHHTRRLLLLFIRCPEITHSSTRETVRPSGAVLREAPSEPSQPSHSESRSAPPQSGEPAAGPSDVPLAEASGAPSFGSSRQRQWASDRAVMPEFLHLSTVFQNGFKALCDKMSNIDRRLENIESELSRPAKHFFSAIHKSMVEHLTPELQISVMQGCNNAYVTALQQARAFKGTQTGSRPTPRGREEEKKKEDDDDKHYNLGYGCSQNNHHYTAWVDPEHSKYPAWVYTEYTQYPAWVYKEYTEYTAWVYPEPE